MRRDQLVPVLLAFGLLTGCGAPAGNGGTPTPMPPESAPPVEGEMICRIVDGAEDGTLLLAEVENGPYDGGGLYSFPVGETPVWIDGARKTAADLTDGMLVTVCWNGMVAESSSWGRPIPCGRKARIPMTIAVSGSRCSPTCGTPRTVLTRAWRSWGWTSRMCPASPRRSGGHRLGLRTGSRPFPGGGDPGRAVGAGLFYPHDRTGGGL